MLVIIGETDGLPVVEFHVVLQHERCEVGQEVPEVDRFGIGAQNLHLILSERFHSAGVCVHPAFVPPQAEPDPVEYGQLALLHHVGKPLIEPGLEHHASDVDAGGISLEAA